MLIGETAGGRWQQDESFTPRDEGKTLLLPVSSVRSLGMMVLCEAAEQRFAIEQIERLVCAPWAAELVANV